MLIALRIIFTPLLFLALAISFGALTGLSVVRGSVLDPEFYLNALEDNHAYDRIYTDYLQGVEQREDLGNLLGGVVVPAADTEAALREVLPPEYLQQQIEAAVRNLLTYLKKDTGQLVLTIDLGPPLSRVQGVAVEYVGARLAAAEQVQVAGYDAYVNGLVSVVLELQQGQVPATIPSASNLTAAQRTAIADLLGGAELTTAERASIDAALAAGDTVGALRAALDRLLGPRVDAAVAALRTELGPGDTLDVAARMAEQNGESKTAWLDDVQPTRDVAETLDSSAVLWAGIVVVLLSLVLLGAIYLPGWRKPAFVAGAALIAVGLLGLVAWFMQANVLPGEARDQVVERDFSSPEMRAIVGDVSESLVHDSASGTWPPAIAALIAGLVLCGLAVGAHYAAERDEIGGTYARRPTRPGA